MQQAKLYYWQFTSKE